MGCALVEDRLEFVLTQRRALGSLWMMLEQLAREYKGIMFCTFDCCAQQHLQEIFPILKHRGFGIPKLVPVHSSKPKKSAIIASRVHLLTGSCRSHKKLKF